MLNQNDIKQLEEKGISREAFLGQIEAFKKGFPSLDLDRPARAGDGIRVIEADAAEEMAAQYDEAIRGLKLTKFVPASGAATRMFKDVFAWRELLLAGVETDALLDSHPEAAKFFRHMATFAFWDDLALAMDKDELNAEHLLEEGNYLPLLNYLLFDPGLDYASLPKALIAFHRYNANSRLAFEEHLVEGAEYGRDEHGAVSLHFTLSPEHVRTFEQHLERVGGHYEQKYGVRLKVSHSVQKAVTDTIAVNTDNLPFREKDGSLLFRPGGHGALIENLNDLDADIVFIKNIDNIVPDRLKPETIRYKKVLASILLGLKKESDAWLRRMDQGPLTADEYLRAMDFACNGLNIDRRLFPDDHFSGQEVLRQKLNRPLRVCGMVKNEGEPGGGPFWVRNPVDGSRSLQIVEMSQIDTSNPAQAAIVKEATHFNPVDLVCSTRNYRGEHFDLREFVDESTGFISHKSKDGVEIKALERPGLWNGAMAFWNTVFMEVPLITFNPVKTINDLLRKEHQQG